MYDERTVAVVVPAYNEAGLVGDVIDTMPSFVDRVYAVDDRSTDGTWTEIREHAERRNTEAASVADDGRTTGSSADDAEVSASFDGGERERSEREPRRTESHGGGPGVARPASPERDAGGDRYVVPVRREENGGVGAAIKTGYRRAVDDEMDVVAVMAGDGQMDPDHLHRIVGPVAEGRADYAKGNRLRSQQNRGSMSSWRFFGNNLLSVLNKVASGYWGISDPQNGYTAISREAIESLGLDDAFDEYGFANDVLVRLNVAGMRVADVPTPPRYGNETSHIEYSSFVPKLSALLARGFVRRLTETYRRGDDRRIAPSYGVGALAVTVGALGAVRNRLSDEDGPGLATALVGVVSLALAVVLDMKRSKPLEIELDDESTLRNGPERTAPEADE